MTRTYRNRPFSYDAAGGRPNQIIIYRITENCTLKELRKIDLPDLDGKLAFSDSVVYNLFHNESNWGWKMQYLAPAVSLEAVTQSSGLNDDLCIVISPTMGGDECAGWLPLDSDNYAKSTNLGDGIFSNYESGGQDMTHQPLDVTCFAERNKGYAESISIGGIICRFDPDGTTPEHTPSDNMIYAFENGLIAPVYGIPLERIHRQ